MDSRELLNKYTYILKINSQIEEIRKETDKRKSSYIELMKKEEKCRGELGLLTFFLCLIPFLLAAVSVLGIISCLFDKDLWSMSIFSLGAAVFFYGIMCLVQTISFAKNDRDKNEEKAAVIHNCEVLPAYAGYEKKATEMNSLIETSGIREIEETIPKDYRSETAINFFIKALENRRADTEKELYNLYEEELHRQKVMAEEMKLLQKLDESLMHCPKCGGTKCTMMIKTRTEHTPFGIGDACCGLVLFGPLGLLCGTCGMGTKTESENYWVCSDCGKKFKK